MRRRFLALGAAVLAAGCAASNGVRPQEEGPQAPQAPAAGPDLTAYLAIGAVT